MVRICCGCPRIAGAGRRLAESEPGGAGEENAGNTQQQECGSPPKPLCKPATGDERNDAAGLARNTADRTRECPPFARTKVRDDRWRRCGGSRIASGSPTPGDQNGWLIPNNSSTSLTRETD